MLYNVIRHTAHQYCFARGSTQMPKTCTKFLFICDFKLRLFELRIDVCALLADFLLFFVFSLIPYSLNSLVFIHEFSEPLYLIFCF